MLKQYSIGKEHNFKVVIRTYHDGKEISKKSIWLGDESDDYIKELEEDGYVFGYTPEEVELAKKEYENKLSKVIGGNKV